MARNYKQCESNIKHIVVLLNKVGLIVNPEKYIFTQVQLIEYLYSIISSLRILVVVQFNYDKRILFRDINRGVFC